MEIKQSYGQLLFDKYAKSPQWEKNLFQQVVLKQFFSTCKKNLLDTYLIYKNYFKMAQQNKF